MSEGPGQPTPPPAPTAHEGQCGLWVSVAMEGSPESGPRGPRDPIPGFEKSTAQLALTWSTTPRFPQGQLEDPEYSQLEYKGEQGGAVCWAPQGDPQRLVFSPNQRLASDNPSGGLQFANT